MNDDAMVRARGLSLGYGGRTVLADLNLTVRAGELWFLLGPNGAGKTTLLRTILGSLPPRGGELWLHPDLASRARVGFVPQRCNLNPTLPTTVREFVLLGLVGVDVAPAARAERLAWALAHAGLGDAAARSYWALSGGQRQRALIARALVRQPRLLLLDEPTNNLNFAIAYGLLQLLAELNRTERLTLLFVTHDLDQASRYATHVAMFHDGAVLAGPRDEVLTPANLVRVYGLTDVDAAAAGHRASA